MVQDKRVDIINDIDANYQEKKVITFYGYHDTNMWVQVGMMRPDCDDPFLVEVGKGGKVYLSEHASEDEIVKKIMGLTLAYVEHETREGFYYKGVRLFGPHISLEAMMRNAHETVGREEIA